MAFTKKKEVFGFEAEYWVITNIITNKYRNKTNVTLSLYKDYDNRITRPDAAILSIEFVIDGFSPTLSTCYSLIKQTESELDNFDGEDRILFFSSAIDS